MTSIPRPSHTATSRRERFFAKLKRFEHIAPGESAYESMLHYTIVYPILEAIIKAVEEKLGDAGVECSYNMDDACPTACKSRKPVTMLYGEGYHFASIAVREDEDEEEEAFDDAIAAAMLLTPKTGYSVIVVGVGGTEVTMGLLSLLYRSKSGVHPRLELAPFPTELKRLLRTVEVERVECERRTVGVHTSDSINKKYGIGFSADEVENGFTDAFQKYLSLLVEPICSGLSGGIVSKQLPDTAQGCPVVMNSNVPDDLQLPAMCAGGVYKIFTAQEYHRVDSLNCAVRPPFCASLTFERCPDEPKSDREERKSAAFWKAVFSELDDPWLRAELNIATRQEVGVQTGEKDEAHAASDESDSLTICCIYRHMDGGSELTERPSAIVAAKLLAMIVVLHDVYEIVHCDVRRSNVVVSGCAVELVGYEHGAMCLYGAKRPPESCMKPLRHVVSKFKKRRRMCFLSMQGGLCIRMMDILSFFLYVWLSDSSIENEKSSRHRQSVLDAITSGMEAVDARAGIPTSEVFTQILKQTNLFQDVWGVIYSNALFKKKSIAEVNAATCGPEG